MQAKSEETAAKMSPTHGSFDQRKLITANSQSEGVPQSSGARRERASMKQPAQRNGRPTQVVLILTFVVSSSWALETAQAPAQSVAGSPAANSQGQLLAATSNLLIDKLLAPALFAAAASGAGGNKSGLAPLLQPAGGHLLQLQTTAASNGVGTKRQNFTTSHQSSPRPANQQPHVNHTVTRAGPQQQQQTRPPHALNSSLQAVRQRWRQMERSLSDLLLGPAAAQLRLALDELAALGSPGGQASGRPPVNLSTGCRLALRELVDTLAAAPKVNNQNQATNDLWASQMLDATARLPSGLLEGTLTELGNFDQCLAIRHQLEGAAASWPPGERLTSGQYCSVQIKPHLAARPRLHTVCQRVAPLSAATNQSSWRLLSQNSHQFYYAGLRLGLCTPSKCSRNEIQHLLTGHLAKYELLGQVKSCQVSSGQASDMQPSTAGDSVSSSLARSAETPPRLDFVQQCIASTLGALLVLAALGTLLDYLGSRASDASRKEGTAGEPVRPPVPAPRSTLMASQSSTNSETIDDSSGEGTERAPGGCRHCSTSWSWSDLAAGKPPSSGNNCVCSRRPANAKQTRRWHAYQVYHSASDLIQSDESSHSIGVQMNPLAADKLLTHSASHTDHKKAPRVNNPLFGYGQSSMAKRPLQASEDDLYMEEDWIARLERNELARLGLQHAHQRPADDEGSRAKAGGGARNKVPWQAHPLIALLTCFSIRRNLRSICSLQAPSGGGGQLNSHKSFERELKHDTTKKPAQVTAMADIQVIHGLRTLTMVWIIFGHTIGLVNPEMMNNLFALAQLSCSSRLLQALLNATLAVNTFFMISGLVTVASFARKCRSAQLLLERNNDVSASDSSKSVAPLSARSKQHPKGFQASGKLHHHHLHHHHHHHLAHLAGDLHGSSAAESPDDSASVLSSSQSSQASSSEHCLNAHQRAAARTRKGAGRRGKPAAEREHGASAWWPADFQPLTWLAMRYLRLTPAYASVIGFSILLPALGSGPFWPETAGQVGGACRENWWLNLLYVNNFLETDRLCLIHSWYLSNDCQFFCLALILLATYYKSKKLTCLLMISFGLASSAATFALTVANEFPPTIVTTSPAVAERWLFIHSLYYKPWPHLTSYLIGLLTGFLIVIRHQLPAIKSPWLHLAWLLWALVGFALLNSIYPWNMGLQVEPQLAGLHSATFRTLWAACSAWLVYALVSRPQSSLAKIFACRGFQVTSRLTYCAYLVHPLLIYYHFGSLRERMDSSVYGQAHRFVATLTLSYLFAFLLSLLIESPSIQLQRLLSGCSGTGATAPGPGKGEPGEAGKKASRGGEGGAEGGGGGDASGKQRWPRASSALATGGLNGPAGRIVKRAKSNNNEQEDEERGQEEEEEGEMAAGNFMRRGRHTTGGSWSATSSFVARPAGGSPESSLATSGRPHKAPTVPGSSDSLMRPVAAGQQHHHQLDANFTSRNLAAKARCHLSCDSGERQADWPGEEEEKTQLPPGSASSGLAGGNSSSSAAAANLALNTDFQKKLAQAIGRGFRIRSRLANSGATIKQPHQQHRLRPQSQPLYSSGARQEQQQQQGAFRLPGGQSRRASELFGTCGGAVPAPGSLAAGQATRLGAELNGLFRQQTRLAAAAAAASPPSGGGGAHMPPGADPRPLLLTLAAGSATTAATPTAGGGGRGIGSADRSAGRALERQRQQIQVSGAGLAAPLSTFGGGRAHKGPPRRPKSSGRRISHDLSQATSEEPGSGPSDAPDLDGLLLMRQQRLVSRSQPNQLDNWLQDNSRAE